MTDNGQPPQEMQRIEELIQQIEATDNPQWQAMATELVQVLMDLHGSGITRMLAIASEANSPGSDLVTRFSQDELVGQLLMLYDLHPVELQTRVEGALASVRPMLQSHGGDVELLGIDEGVVRLKLDGSCDGCPSSALTLKNAIETAIYDAAPDIVALEVDGVVEERIPDGFVPLEMMTNGSM